MDKLKILKDILDERRRQINIAFEGKDERMMAHMHTFINKFEEEVTLEAVKHVIHCTRERCGDRLYCAACWRFRTFFTLKEKDLE